MTSLLNKLLGIVLIIVAVSIFLSGIKTISDYFDRKNSIGGKIGAFISKEYKENLQDELIAGIGLISGGVILFIVGVGMGATKTKSKKNKKYIINLEKEYGMMNSEDKYSKLEKIGKYRDQGLLNEEEFNNEKQKILNEL
jgi:hypothetical protein